MSDEMIKSGEQALDLYSNVEVDYDNFDIGEVEIDKTAEAAELERGEGLGKKAAGKTMFYVEMGHQMIQVVPFAAPNPGGGFRWCWFTAVHVHKNFLGKSADCPELKAMREEVPGYELVCRSATFGKECPVCELKWDVGNKFKETHPELGYRHKDMWNLGLYSKERWAIFVQVLQSAGAWLEEDEGKKWKVKMANSLSNKESVEIFTTGISEAEQSHSTNDGWDSKKPYMMFMFKEQFKELSDASADRNIGDIHSLTRGVPFQLKCGVDDAKKFRDHSTTHLAHMRRPLRTNEDNTPNKAEIKEMLAQTRNLNALRQDWSPAIARAVQSKVLEIREAYSLKGSTGSGSSGAVLPAPRPTVEGFSAPPASLPAGIPAPVPTGSVPAPVAPVSAPVQPVSAPVAAVAPVTAVSAPVQPVPAPVTQAVGVGAGGKPDCHNTGSHSPASAVCQACDLEYDCTGPNG